MIARLTRLPNPGFWLAALVAILLDRLTKQWAVARLLPGPEIELWPGVFHLTYVENTGAAWSLFQESGGFLKWISLAVAVGLLIFALRFPLPRREQIGYGLILAGAVGNGIDRFATGYVVDFLNVIAIQFPVFNVADVAINLGVGLLLLQAMLTGSQSRPTPPPAETQDPPQ
ncbi:MAG: signal peptidase II [Cyanobacteriota bacterium]|nr:signal peptidase II [Cyanobacteriota bacterium]